MTDKQRAQMLSFGTILDLAQEGLARWRDKPHNAKWWRRIDGTPIPNDLLVNIAEVIAQSLAAQPASPAATAMQDNLREAWSALAMIREAIETLAPSGSVKASEYLDGPTFMHEADALVAGIQAIASPAAQPVAWECMGREQSLPEPGECNWPYCGCDPHATKVIEALIEQGWIDDRAIPAPQAVREDDWPPLFEMMKLQARRKDGNWIDIFPAQLEQMVKQGLEVRALAAVSRPNQRQEGE